jgi:threonyl-tRNA synthetase
MSRERYEDSQLYRIRHSAAHIMAEAVLERMPEAKIAIGPPIEDGFYYDFDLPRPITGKISSGREPQEIIREGTVHSRGGPVTRRAVLQEPAVQAGTDQRPGGGARG